jgi:hypothetical protein
MAAGSIFTRPLGASTRAGEFAGNSKAVDVQPLLIRTSASRAITSNRASWIFFIKTSLIVWKRS